MILNDLAKRLVDSSMELIDKISMPVQSLVKSINNGDIRLEVPYRRRGDYAADAAMIESGSVSSRKKKRAGRPISLRQIKMLGDSDPITWAIRKARRDQISRAQWSITRNTDEIEASLDQWHNNVKSSINNWGIKGFGDDKIPSNIDSKLAAGIHDRIVGIMNNSMNTRADKKAQIRWVFENAISYIRFEADEKAKKVKIFKRPCRESPTWNSFIPRVLDDILLYDAGVIIKNKSRDESNPVAELYVRPGNEIVVMRAEDGSVPEPPDKAYCWMKDGKEMAEFTDDEMIYIMANPQHDCYGFSPCEIAAFIITTTLFVDNYNMEFFKYSNVPPGIMDLGESVTPNQRRTFARYWDQEIQRKGGLHKLMFISGSKGASYIPLRPYSSKDMQMFEYLKWSLSIKSACFQISPQDIGFTMDLHRTTSEVQYRISQDRGLKALLELIQSHVNEEIIQRAYGYDDVQFKYVTDTPLDKAQEAMVDIQDLSAGVISINDRRKKLKMRPKEGGDVIWTTTPNGQVPIEMADDIAEKMLVEGEETGETESGANGLQQQQSPRALQAQNSVSQRMNVQTTGGPAELRRVMNGVVDNLKKNGEDTIITIDHKNDEFDNLIQKYYGQLPSQIRFEPLKNKEQEKLDRLRRQLNVSKEVLTDAIVTGIADQTGTDRRIMHNARYQLGRNAAYMAIPTALLVAAISSGGRGLVSRAANIFSRNPRTGPVIGRTIRIIRPYTKG